MNKRDLAYKLYDAGVIAFDDYQCVDCGGNNVLVDSFYACAVEIEASAGRDGFFKGVAWILDIDVKDISAMVAEEAAKQYAESILNGELK